MRTAVVIPYCNEPDAWIERAVRSVLAQTCPAMPFVVADGPSRQWLDAWPVRHVVLGHAHADYGNTPRGVGAALALREGFAALAYLDADNLFEPEHLQRLHEVRAHYNADVVTCARHFLRPDGTRITAALPDEDFTQHTDTNCYLLSGRGLKLASFWLRIPPQLALIGDRVFRLALVKQGMRISHIPLPSVGYTTLWRAHYESIGEVPPPGAKVLDVQGLIAWWSSLSGEQKRAAGAAMGLSDFDLEFGVS